MENKIKKLWVKVSNDEYELPEIVADSRLELSQKLGIKPNSISRAIMRSKETGTRCLFHVVEV